MLNWDLEVDLGLTDPANKLDIFFQPGLSWVKENTASQSPKGIALFFLENDVNKVEKDPITNLDIKTGLDFQQLLKAMLQWIWQIDRLSTGTVDGAGTITPSADAKPPGYFEGLYDKFKTKPFTYTQFIDFLSLNFEFKIQEATKKLNGTIFPMFPMISLEVGNPIFPPPQLPISAKGMQDGLGNLTSQITFDHDFVAETSTTLESAREFIFEDYGQLLLKTAIQELNPYLVALPASTPISMDGLIVLLEQDNYALFDNIAGVASRFLLHGLRLPVSGFSDKGLFEATGQQFNLEKALDSTATDPKPFIFKLSRPPAQVGFLTFVHAPGSSQVANSLTYELRLDENINNNKYPLAALIEGFKDLQSLSDPLSFDNVNGEATGITPMSYYRNQKRIYSMHKAIGLKRGTATQFYSLLQVPSGLSQFLAQTTNNPTINLYSTSAGQNRGDPLENLIANSEYNWAAQLDMLVRQIPKTDEAGFITGVFELVDISEAQINLLESILKGPQSQSDNKLGFVKIQILGFDSASNGLAPLGGNINDFRLIRHNFSTNGSIPPLSNLPPTMAGLPASNLRNGNSRKLANEKFLKLLWEGATLESGGYFFTTTMTATEHQALFASRDSIFFSLLVEYDLTGDPIFDFHNTVVIKRTTSDFFENNILLAAVGVSPANTVHDIPVLAIPPGFIGFEHVTAEAQPEPKELPLASKVQLRAEPKLTGAPIGSELDVPENVDVFNISEDGKWVFANTTEGLGWLPIQTENPDVNGAAVPPTVHLAISNPANFNRVQALAELKSLYHLLGYGIVEHPFNNNLPIGPAADPDIENGPWTYEKLIPAHASSPKPAEFILLTDSQLRENPNASADPIGALIPIGEKVYVFRPSGDGLWAFVSYKNQKGWIALSTTFTDIPNITVDPNWPATAPPWNQNPYRGITPYSNLILKYWWQDIYGNKITSQTVSKPFEVRYTDPLIGINQWPSLNERYQFIRDANGLWLEIEFVFTPKPYQDLISAGDTLALERRLKADLSTYQKLYYQLHGPGVDFLVQTSLDDSFSQPISVSQVDQHPTDPKNLSSFVLSIYEYLAGVDQKREGGDLANAPDYVGSSYFLQLNLSSLSPKAVFIQGISVWMTMRRSADLVLPSLKSNTKLRGIFENKAILSPKHESVEFTLTDPAPTLEILAAGIQSFWHAPPANLKLPPRDSSFTVTARDVMEQHRDLSGILVPNLVIVLDDLELKSGDTFGTKRGGLAAAEVALDGTTDPSTGVAFSREPGLHEGASRTVTIEVEDSFDSLTGRIDKEIKDILGPKYPMNFILADLAENFKAELGFLKPNISLTLEPLNIRRFAQNFSEAFPDFHLAVSEERIAGGGQANLEEGRPEFLFAVRLGGTGIGYDITDQDPNFYSIPPISTSLFSGEVTIYTDPKTSGGQIKKEVEGIDANVLAREFLGVFEEVLDPAILARARKDASADLDLLLQNKIKLASKIANTVVHILEEDKKPAGVSIDPRLQEAQDAMHQQLLKNLREGFDIESIVQYEATIRTGTVLSSTPIPATSPPRMVGKAKVLRVQVGEDPETENTAEKDDLDFTLSTGYFDLDRQDQQSSFTYLFDTKTPEKFGNLKMEMEFQPLEMEFNLANFPDTSSPFESSNKLRFILPDNLNVYKITQVIIDKMVGLFGGQGDFDTFFKPALISMKELKFFSLAAFEEKLGTLTGKDLDGLPFRRYTDALLSDANPNYMGRTTIPIPLRFYPLAPSLILQEAEIDESAREVIRDLREWRYTLIYEHPEVAQDSIDCIIKVNVPDTAQAAGNVIASVVTVPEFVRLLLNFKEILPDIQSAIEDLKKEDFDNNTPAGIKTLNALGNLASLSSDINTNWGIIRGIASQHYAPVRGDLHFEVSEETLTFVGETKEAESRQGLVFNLTGPLEEDLIKLDNATVEENGIIPTDEELLKRSILKRGSTYLKNLVPELELPGFLKARWIEFETSGIEAEILKRFNDFKANATEEEVQDRFDESDANDVTLEEFKISELRILGIVDRGDPGTPEYFRPVIPGQRFAVFIDAEITKRFNDFKANATMTEVLERFNTSDVNAVTLEKFKESELPLMDITIEGTPSDPKYVSTRTQHEILDSFLVPAEVPIAENPDFSSNFYELDKNTVESSPFSAAQLAQMGFIQKGTAPNHHYIKLKVPGAVLPQFMIDAGFEAAKPLVFTGIAPPEIRTFFFSIDRGDQTFFGDSSIPDRKLSIDNLDLFQQQNAWGSIFLSRNKNLVFNKTTNPDFIYRTPAVRFTNRLTPSIINNEPWDIATLPLGELPVKNNLLTHLTNLMDLFDPGVTTVQAKHQRYELQVSCRYAFALAQGTGLNEDLVTTLPLLLGLRLRPSQLVQYPALLRKEISIWFEKHQPVDRNASLVFSIEAYSQLDPNANTSLPLLRVTNLDLSLSDILDMPDIRAHDLARLPSNGPAVSKSLVDHLGALMTFFKKGINSQKSGEMRYELQIDYQFTSAGVETTTNVLSDFWLDATTFSSHPNHLHQEIRTWILANLPVETDALFVFVVKVFAQPESSRTTGLDLLKETHAKLNLTDISDWVVIKTV